MKQFLSAEDIAAILRGEGDESISARTVHYYAEQRLLPPPVYHGSRPRYTDTHLAAMRRARALKQRGYSLERIAVLVEQGEEAQPLAMVCERSLSASAPALSPMPSMARSAMPTTRTLVVAPGLTLSAAGWDDAALNHVVRAIHDALATLGRADARERDNHDTSA